MRCTLLSRLLWLLLLQVGSFFEFPLLPAKALYFVAEPRMFFLKFPHLTVVLPVAEEQRTVISFLILLRHVYFKDKKPADAVHNRLSPARALRTQD
jgi:hypothetical protein